MPNERSSVTQLVQVAPEVTPGTAVTATKKLQVQDFETDPQITFDEFRPNGFKFLTVDAPTKEWVSAKMKGQMTFGELIYPLAGLITPTPNPPTIALGAYKWIFEPTPSSTTDVPITYTIEQGSSVRAQKFTYGLFTGFGFTHTRDKVDMTGELIARSLQDNITITPSLPGIELVPATANLWDVYLDTTSAGLGTTKLTRVFSGAFEFTNRWGPLWVIDTSQSSFAGHVELAPTVTYKCVVEADAQGMGLLASLRTNSTQFLRVKCTGPVIGSTVYSATFDMATKVASISAFKDEQGVYAVEFTFQVIYDATWNKAIHIEVVNGVTGL